MNNDLHNLEKFLIDIHSNILNTKILSFNKLMTQLKKVTNYIPANHEFPFDIYNPDMKTFINFLKLGYLYV